jgi:hypothetical protein
MKPETESYCNHCGNAMPLARMNKKFCSNSCRSRHRRFLLAVNQAACVAPPPPFAAPNATNFKPSHPSSRPNRPTLQRIAANVGRGGAIKQPNVLESRHHEIGAADLLLEPSETFRLDYCLGEFMGELDRHGTAIAITGEECLGRTKFALMLAFGMEATGMRVKYLSLQRELAWFHDERTSMARIGKSIEVADWADLGAIRRAARLFDAVVIDTYSALSLGQHELARLKADFPRTAFVCVHEKTKGGELMGGICNRLCSAAVVDVVQDGHRGFLAVMRKSHGGRMGYGLGLDDDELYLPGEFPFQSCR